MSTLNTRQAAAATVAGLAFALIAVLPGCATVGPSSDPGFVSPAPAPVTGIPAYLDAVEFYYDEALGTEGAFDAAPGMRDVALDVADNACRLQAEGFTEQQMLDAASTEADGEQVRDLMLRWITAATTYVC